MIESQRGRKEERPKSPPHRGKSRGRSIRLDPVNLPAASNTHTHTHTKANRAEPRFQLTSSFLKESHPMKKHSTRAVSDTGYILRVGFPSKKKTTTTEKGHSKKAKDGVRRRK